MKSIVLLNKSKNGLGKEIYNLICKYFKGCYISDNEIIIPNNDFDFILTEVETLTNLNTENSIVILGSVYKGIDKNIFDASHSIIVSAENGLGLEMLKYIDKQIFVCGMSVRDTVSITSLIGDTATVCLKRKVEKINGEEIEESELSLPKSNNSIFALMCAAVVILLN